MVSIEFSQLPTQILIHDGIITTGIPISFSAKGKPANSNSFWVGYVNKARQEYELGFEIKKISDGLKLDLLCIIHQRQGNNFEKVRELTIHLDQNTDRYDFTELG